jgi:hypothetical protein
VPASRPRLSVAGAVAVRTCRRGAPASAAVAVGAPGVDENPRVAIPDGDRARFQMDDGEGKPSRWNTLRAMRVLDWFAQGG